MVQEKCRPKHLLLLLTYPHYIRTKEAFHEKEKTRFFKNGKRLKTTKNTCILNILRIILGTCASHGS